MYLTIKPFVLFCLTVSCCISVLIKQQPPGLRTEASAEVPTTAVPQMDNSRNKYVFSLKKNFWLLETVWG